MRAETGRFRRFPRPTILSGFLGIVPSERTSDTARREGLITEAAPRTPAASSSKPPSTIAKQPAISQTLARRQEGQDPRVIEIAWRAQRRLHQRWTQLHYKRRKPAGVTAIAVARERAGSLWGGARLGA